MRWLVLLSTGVSNAPGGGYLHWRPPSVVLLQRWSCLNFSSRNWDEEGGRLCVKMAVGGKCGKFSGSSVGYLAGGGWQTFHCIEGEQARDRGTSVIGRTLPSTLSCSLGPHLKSLELELRQRVTEDRAATHQKNINYTCTPGPLFLPPRPPWRRAHSYLRGHIWLVVIRAFVASQANHAGFGGEIINFPLWISLGLED